MEHDPETDSEAELKQLRHKLLDAQWQLDRNIEDLIEALLRCRGATSVFFAMLPDSRDKAARVEQLKMLFGGDDDGWGFEGAFDNMKQADREELARLVTTKLLPEIYGLEDD